MKWMDKKCQQWKCHWNWITYSSTCQKILLISSSGRSQGLLFEHLCYSFTKYLINLLGKIYLWRRHAQTVKAGASIYKANYIDILSEILNPEGHLNCYIASKVTAILLNGLILPTDGASSRLEKKNSLNSAEFNSKKNIFRQICLNIPPNLDLWTCKFEITLKVSSF